MATPTNNENQEVIPTAPSTLASIKKDLLIIKTVTIISGVLILLIALKAGVDETMLRS